MAPAVLTEINPDGSKRVFPLLKETITIGRSPENDLVLTNPQTSRNHAKIILEGSQYKILDLQSTVGLFLNHSKVTSAFLNNNDEIQIGTAKLLFTAATPASSEVGKTLVINLKDLQKNVELPQAEYHFGEKNHYLIGREHLCDVHIDLPQVSRKHAMLRKIEDRWLLQDLNSTNGTYVNGKRILKKILEPKDTIQFGAIRFLFKTNAFIQLDQKGEIRIDAVQISKFAYGHKLIDNISLSILPHEFVGILGPSGAGKSTLINVLNGFDRISSGQIYINSTNFYHNYQAFKTTIGSVPQDDILYQELSVLRMLYYSAKLRLPGDTSNEEIDLRVQQVIEQVGLQERMEIPITRLSGGQRKRVNLAVELITDPSLLFLDEPTAGLDPLLALKLEELFRALTSSGRTVVHSTHRLDQIALFDQVALLSGGKLIFYGPPSELLEYFKADSILNIYQILEKKTPLDWEQQFLISSNYKKNIKNRIDQGLENETKEKEFPLLIRDRPKIPLFKQLVVVTQRYFELLFKDKKNVLILLAQAPVIALLLVLIFNKTHEPWRLLFCLSISSIWFGCTNAIKEISKEKTTYFRERLATLRIIPYVTSKVILLLGLCVLQCGFLLSIVKTGVVLEGEFLQLYLTLLLSSAAGITLGLFISSLAGTTDKALSLLPLILIPQIFFSGALIEFDRMVPLGTYLSYLMISRWSYSLLKNLVTWKEGSGLQFEWVMLGTYTLIFYLLCLISQRIKDQKVR